MEGLALNLKTCCSTEMHITFERRIVLNILDFKNYFKEKYFLIAFSVKMKGCVCESKVLPGRRK